MEECNLSTPITTPAITTWRVDEISLCWSAATIVIVLRGPRGERLSHTYSSTTATTLMTAINKANLSTISLHKCILNRLVTDGVITGTVSGSPD